VKNIVLVHGAWADGSGWRGVYNNLVRDGFNVSIVQEPATSFRDDVTAVKRVLALQDVPTILVAHSYGGSVVTEAGTDPSVVGLVYVAAHMPDAGESESSLIDNPALCEQVRAETVAILNIDNINTENTNTDKSGNDSRLLAVHRD
jgi:pimeloyl-ACP methyl ester carboxylesterase